MSKNTPLENLHEQLMNLAQKLETKDKEALLLDLENLISNYPFNEYEYIISHLLGLDRLTLEEYKSLRERYNDENEHLYLFSISAPRGFGEKWAQNHITDVEPKFLKPDKKLHEEYAGDYDLWAEYKKKGIRIEVKASRAVDYDRPDVPLLEKALATYSENRFDMNFQQIKPAHCDVFIWIAVWSDKIRYWVLNSKDVATNKYFSDKQHRGNIGEGQLHFNKENIEEFKKFEVKKENLYKAVVKAYKKL